ncbi:MAG: hypothetical protein Q8920_07875 [Bacillota bacterium]|nr:hypothetical protein [Bacillota bacterium]
MKQKILAVFLILVFILAQIGTVDARGFSGGRSRSYSSHSSGYRGSSSRSVPKSTSKSSSSKSKSSSSSKSSGYSGSSSSKKSASASSSRSMPGSYSTGSAKTSSKSTKKSSYMQDYYKQQTSKMNYKSYKQNLNTDQKKVYDSTMNRSYSYNNRMNFEDAMGSRPQRVSSFEYSNPVRIHINTFYFGGPLSYGSAFVGPWDLWFLMRASDLFWYHHWLEIMAYQQYFDSVEFAQRQQAIAAMQAQNIQRDPNYVDPNVDYDLQFSNDYEQAHLDSLYYTNRYQGSGSSVLIILICIGAIAIGLVLVARHVSRPKYKRPSRSGIY